MDLDPLVRTVWGEARNQSPEGQLAVASVILNRARQSGQSIADVVQAPGQFEPWGNAGVRAQMTGMSADSPEYQAIAANIQPALQGYDPTGGADHFYSPKAQAALGRRAPSWDDGSGVDLGDHRFFRLGYKGGGQVSGFDGASIFGFGGDNQVEAGPAGDAPAADAGGGFDGSEIFGQAAAAPAGPAAASRAHPIVITNADTGEAYSDAIQGVYGDLMKRGAIDPNAPIGSEKFPRVMVAGGQPAPGEWYVDETGMHAAPGVRDPSFGETFGEALVAPWQQLGRDVKDGLKTHDAGPIEWTPEGLGREAVGFGKDLAADVAAPFKIGGSLLAAVSSPVTALLEAGVVQPGAKLMDRIPLDAYSSPELHFDGDGLSITPSRRLTDQEKHDANAEGLRMGLSAIPAGPKGARLGELADANEAAAAARQARIDQGIAEPSDVDRARRILERRLGGQGLGPDELVAAEAAAGGKPIMTAETLGRQGERMMRTAAGRGGRSADALGAELRARATERGDRVARDFGQEIGVDPDAALGDIEAMVAKGQELAHPHYEAARPQPAWNNEIADVFRTPDGQKAWERGVRIMRNEFKDPETLGLSFIENPDAWDSYVAPGFGPAAEPERAVGFAGGVRGPAKAPSRGQGLGDFVSSRGGMSDQGGDAASLGLDRWHAGRPFARRLLTDPSQAPLPGQPGQAAWYVHPEAVAQRAYEAGYFPELGQAPTPEQLLYALSEEMRGRVRYAREADAGAQSRFEGRNAADELEYYGGDPEDLPTPDDYVGRPAPRSEPAYEQVPKVETLHYMKRGLDDLIAKETAPDGKISDLGKSYVAIKQKLTRALVGDPEAGVAPLSPEYAEGHRIANSYLGEEAAFKLGSESILNRRVSQAEFNRRIGTLKHDGEFMRFQEGAVHGLREQADRGLLSLQSLDNPLFQKKLQVLLGEQRAKSFLASLAKERGMQAFEHGANPRGGSQTADLLQEAAGQNQALQTASELVPIGRMLKRGDALGALIAGLSRTVDGAARTASRLGMSDGVADELVRQGMLSPSDFAELLRSGTPEGAPPARKRYRGAFGSGVLALPVTEEPRERQTQRLAR